MDVGRGRPQQRSELGPLSARLADASAAPYPFSEHADRPREILRILTGSLAYGLERGESDADVRSVHVIPTARLSGIGGRAVAARTSALHDAAGNDSYELAHFCELALQASPAVIELLFVRPEHVLRTTAEGERLRAVRAAFLSRVAITSYRGYAAGASKRFKLSGPRPTDYERKPVVHLLRLMIQGIRLLRSGELDVRVPEHLTEELLAIYRGERPYGVVRARVDHLLAELDTASDECVLPSEPDRAAIDAAVGEIRRGVWD